MLRMQEALNLIQLPAAKGVGLRARLERLETAARLHFFGVRDYVPNVSFRFERAGYLIKTAENGTELEQCLRLRFQVFNREYKDTKLEDGVDVDSFDAQCDHLMIINTTTGRLVGTYRLNSSLFTDRYYSCTEFRMDHVLELPGKKLELGRACIEAASRNGAVFALLWRGISEYIQLTGTTSMFGCASIKTTSAFDAAQITEYLRNGGYMLTDAEVQPTLKYTLRDLPEVKRSLGDEGLYREDIAKKLIPPLLAFYLRAGAKVCGEPAVDWEFNCIDYLVLLRIEGMDPTVKGKFKL